MANFFTEPYMARRRAQFLRSIHKLQARSGGVWYDGEIQKKEVSGDTLIINCVFSALDGRAATLDRSRIFDVYGEVVHEQVESITKATGQGVMIQVKVPIKEAT